jgi:putative tryptophan/tyrosine transport system substrate-binding protein
MRRREFIALFGGAAVWPLAASAQSPERVARIGVLVAFSEDDPEGKARVAAFAQGLRDAGWIEGRNLKVDYRWAQGNDKAGIQKYAKELVDLHPDLIVGHNTPQVAALVGETNSIPIVFVSVGDPVGSGFVASIARPGHNVTGFTNLEPSISSKWLEILKELAPGMRRVGVIFNPQTAPGGGSFFLQPFEAASLSLSIVPIRVAVKSSGEIADGIAALAQGSDAGLIVMPDIFMTNNRDFIIAAAAQYRLPAIYPYQFFVQNGGLISYGVDNNDMHRRSASYVDSILKGAKPSDLPVQFPTKYEMAVNLKAAKALGLIVPASLVSRADQVIE